MKIILLILFIIVNYCNGNLIIWAVSDSTKVKISDAVQTSNHIWDGNKNTINIKGAKNEYIGFQIIIRAEGSGLTGVNLTANNLSGSGVITSNNYEFFKVKYVGIYPDPLVPFNSPTDGAPFNVSVNNNQPIWVDLYIPSTTQSGTYTGVVTITAAGGILQNITINLEVYDFALPKTKHLRAVIPTYAYEIYSKEGWGNPNSNRATRWNDEKKYYIMAHNHRFDLTCEGPFKPNITFNTTTGAITSEDWTEFDGYVTSLFNGSAFSDGEPQATWEAPIYDSTLGGGFPKGSDFSGFVPAVKNNSTQPMSVTTHQVCPASYSAAVTNLAAAIANHFSSKGWIDKLYCYMWNNKNVFDEPIGGFYPDIREMYDLIHKGSNKLKIMQIGCPDPKWDPEYYYYYGWSPSDGFLYGSGTYGDYVNIWCPPPHTYVVDYSSYDGGIAPIKLGTQNGGKESWFYQGGEPIVGSGGLSTTGPGFRSWPWIAWKYKVDGIFYWNCTYWDTSDPYSSQNNDGDGILFYPGGPKGISGPVSSIRMKQWRRGMQDYEYMWLAKQSGANPDAVVEAILTGDQLGYKSKKGSINVEWDTNLEHWDIAKEQLANMIISGSNVDVNLNNIKVYPNPFNPSNAYGGKIKIINLPIGVDFDIEIYNVNGELVKVLKHSDFGNLGIVEWDGKNNNGISISRGVYYYVIKGGGGKKLGKIALTK